LGPGGAAGAVKKNRVLDANTGLYGRRQAVAASHSKKKTRPGGKRKIRAKTVLTDSTLVNLGRENLRGEEGENIWGVIKPHNKGAKGANGSQKKLETNNRAMSETAGNEPKKRVVEKKATHKKDNKQARYTGGERGDKGKGKLRIKMERKLVISSPQIRD